MSLGSAARGLFKAFAILALLVVAGVGILLGSLWLERKSDVTLPIPTGPFAVGRTIQDWTDSSAVDSLAPVSGTRRELLAWIWYPADAAPNAAMDDYMPAYIRKAAGPSTGFFSLLTRDASRAHGHSLKDPAVSPGKPSYPVVIMRAGASSGVLNYSSLAEDLASHGYVVVGFDAPYRTGFVAFPDGRTMGRTDANNPEICGAQEQSLQDHCVSRLLAAWTADVGFTLDRMARLNADSSGRFTGRLDLSRVGVFGHSFGGATAAQFCHDDARCKAGIDVDGQPFGSVVGEGVGRPFMFLLSDHGKASDPVSRQIEANIQSIYDRLPPESRVRLVIRGANHFTFSDDGTLMKSGFIRWLLRRFGKLGIDGRRQLAVTSYCLQTFFDAHLNGAALDLPSPRYPEIQVQR